MIIALSCGKDGEKVDETEKDLVKSISEEYKAKIERYLKDIISFDVHIKCHHKKGNIKRYVVVAGVISSGYNIKAKSDEYDLRDAATKCMQKLLSEVEHKTHSGKI
jgi:ribosome-associated translation inhibitor RaiA